MIETSGRQYVFQGWVKGSIGSILFALRTELYCFVLFVLFVDRLSGETKRLTNHTKNHEPKNRSEIVAYAPLTRNMFQ
jgi:hypothetical protein